MKSHANDSPQTDTVLSDTRIWLERAVIGLNLCPFAKGVQVKGQIHELDGPQALAQLRAKYR